MPFIRLSDNYIDHPKIVGLSSDAFRLWHEGLAYCRRHQTDGLIRTAAIPSLRSFRDETVRELLTALDAETSPLWRTVEGGYVVHDYLQWNQSRQDERAAKAGTRDRVRRHRAGKKSVECNGVTNAFVPDMDMDTDLDQSGSVQEKENVTRYVPVTKRERNNYDARTVSRKDSVFSGQLPRDHVKHAACSENMAWCVPVFAHENAIRSLLPRFDGDRDAACNALHEHYVTIWNSLDAHFVMGDALKFWQAQFDAAFASPVKTPAKQTAMDRLEQGIDEWVADVQAKRATASEGAS